MRTWDKYFVHPHTWKHSCTCTYTDVQDKICIRKKYILKVTLYYSKLLSVLIGMWTSMKTSLDFNYVKPCLDLIKLKLQLLTLWLGVYDLTLSYLWNKFMSLWQHGMVWLCLRQHPSEASVKISSRSDLFWLF